MHANTSTEAHATGFSSETRQCVCVGCVSVNERQTQAERGKQKDRKSAGNVNDNCVSRFDRERGGDYVLMCGRMCFPHPPTPHTSLRQTAIIPAGQVSDPPTSNPLLCKEGGSKINQ